MKKQEKMRQKELKNGGKKKGKTRNWKKMQRENKKERREKKHNTIIKLKNRWKKTILADLHQCNYDYYNSK